MWRIFTATVVALAVSTGPCSGPASAQMLRIRFWATPASPQGSGYYPYPYARPLRLNYLDSTTSGNIVWDSTITGFEYRSRPHGRWLASLTYDVGSVDNLVDGEFGFGRSPGTNRFFSVNLHYRSTPVFRRDAEVTVFAGYGSGSLEVTVPAGIGLRSFHARGLRYGADVYIPVRTVWYFTGFAAYGRWAVTHTVLDTTFSPEGIASVREYGGALGRWVTPAAALEAGYRGIYWDTGVVGGSACPCAMSWSGYYAGLVFRPR